MSHMPFKSGATSLVGGVVDVADPSILATSKVLVSNVGVGGTIGILSVKITPGSSFTINSANILDTSAVNYLVLY